MDWTTEQVLIGAAEPAPDQYCYQGSYHAF